MPITDLIEQKSQFDDEIKALQMPIDAQINAIEKSIIETQNVNSYSTNTMTYVFHLIKIML